MRKSDGSYTYFVPDVAYHLAQVRARLHQGDQHPGHRPPRHDRARPRRPAGGRRRRAAGYPDYVLQHDGPRRARRRGSEDLQARRQLRDAARPDRVDQQRRGALLHAEQEGRHRVHLRRRPRAQAERREPGLLRPVRARAHLLGARAVRGAGRRRRRAGRRRPRRAWWRRARPRCCSKLADYPSRCSPPPRRRSRRTRSRSTCASWRRRSTATTPPSDSSSTIAELARARLALLAATRQIIRNALAVLGVGAPERMKRETDTA